MILNLINKKVYIGSASSNRINVRFRNHCIHHTGSKLVSQAIKKHGIENFAFIILDYYPGFVKKENLTKAHIALLNLETSWIEKIKPEYNILCLANSNLKDKHKKEVIIKMKENFSEIRREFCRNLNLNKSFSDEKKKLLSKIATLRNQNDKLKKNLAEKSSKPVTLYNQDGTIHSNYSGVRVMARYFKCCHKTINLNIKNQLVFKNIGQIKYTQPNFSIEENQKDR